VSEVIVISGASSGFGRLSAIALARAGHTVYASMREANGRNKPIADEYAEIAAQENLDLGAIEMDAGDQISVDAAIGRIVSEQGRLDVVIHNAGYMSYGPAEAFTVEELAQLYDVNALSTQRVNRAALPHLRAQRRGLLLWISSTRVKDAWCPYLAGYVAAKAGMEQLAVSYAGELARFGIETSIVMPGVFTTGTNYFAHAMTPADQERAAIYVSGPTADLGDKLFAGMKSLEPPDSDPQAVVRAIVEIVGTPHGKRPFRITVGPAEDGSEIVAAMSDRLRADLLRRIGLGDLLTPATAGGSLTAPTKGYSHVE
jgi:NAD(P)-dependent dehydrogenase (short-subunit alcohol dehydrogenase family)